MTFLTAGEMAEADRMSIDELGISVVVLMENAGWAVARLARQMLGRTVDGKKVCCLVGKGNNGGDGLVAARCLTIGGPTYSWSWVEEEGSFATSPLVSLP